MPNPNWPLLAQFTPDEIVKIRAHLGYLNVAAASTYILGVPAMVQTQFMVEGAVNAVLIQAATEVRTLICRMDAVIEKVYCGMDLAEVESVDSVKVNRARMKELAEMYKLAQQSLANLLGIVPNPFDLREWLMGGGINVPTL